jgi:hypothetical protein
MKTELTPEQMALLTPEERRSWIELCTMSARWTPNISLPDMLVQHRAALADLARLRERLGMAATYIAGEWEHGDIVIRRYWADQPDWWIVFSDNIKGHAERIFGPAGELETVEPGTGFPDAEAAFAWLETWLIDEGEE